jgi:hypothetical protein
MKHGFPGTFPHHTIGHGTLFKAEVTFQATSPLLLEADYLVRIDQLVGIKLLTVQYSTLRCLI